MEEQLAALWSALDDERARWAAGLAATGLGGGMVGRWFNRRKHRAETMSAEERASAARIAALTDMLDSALVAEKHQRQRGDEYQSRWERTEVELHEVKEKLTAVTERLDEVVERLDHLQQMPCYPTGLCPHSPKAVA